MASNTRVLFNWKPRNLSYGIGQRLRRRLAKAGWYTLSPVVVVRWPELNAEPYVYDMVTEWHKDEGVNNFVFAVWSNIRPTEVRFPDGSLLPTRDGDVILIYNSEVEHRAPADPSGRWFVKTGLLVEVV